MSAIEAIAPNGLASPVPAESKVGRLWPWLRLILLGLLLAAVTGTVMALPLLPDSRVVLEPGDVAPQDVRAPRSITYESEILRAEERERAASRVQPEYTRPDPALARQQVDRARKVLDYLGSVLADPLASDVQKRAWVLTVPEMVGLSPEALEAFLTLSEESWHRVQLETLAVIDQAMRGQIREGHIEDALAGLPSLVSFDLNDAESAVTVTLARTFLVANSFLDPEGTAEAQARAQDGVPPVLRTFKADEIIVREGQRVSVLDIEALDELGLRYPRVEVLDFIAAGLLALLGTALLFVFLWRFQPTILWDGQQLMLLVLMVSFFVVVSGVMVPGGSILRYLAPAPALAMLVTVALGPHAGIATSVFLGGAVGVLADGSIEMAAYAMMGGLVASLMLGKVERIRELFVSGAYAALVHVVVIVSFRLPQDASQPSEVLVSALAGVANGGISASLALGMLFLIGPLFDIVTTMRLIEISRPDHPLLQRLLREAPGTYHHSLMVANLAEHAAERIGANALLARVGAYYHDIGKITRPYFFTENQAQGTNPHDQLDPRSSVEVILSHVTDGLELARRYHLPRRVREFTPGHHGTNHIGFFYGRALELVDDPAEIDEGSFRYPGPKPQAREVALVMLADSCEATVRARSPDTPDAVGEIVDEIISRRLTDGQLSECDLTIRDLDLAREAFKSVLRGVFHPRVQYPQPERQEQTPEPTSANAESLDRDTD